MDQELISDIAEGRNPASISELKYALEHYRGKPHDAFKLYMLYGYRPGAVRIIATDEGRRLGVDGFFMLVVGRRFTERTLPQILATWDLHIPFSPVIVSLATTSSIPRWLGKALLIFHKMPRVAKHVLAVHRGDSRESPAHLYATLRLLDAGLLRFSATARNVKFARFVAITYCLPDELQQLICCRAMCFKEFEHRSWSRHEWIREESYGNSLLLWLHCMRKKRRSCTLL
jgi:hypothetical protein